MVRKTNVRQHTRKVKGRPVNVVRHQRSLQPESLGRVGYIPMNERNKTEVLPRTFACRNCGQKFTAEDNAQLGGVCHKCGKKITPYEIISEASITEGKRPREKAEKTEGEKRLIVKTGGGVTIGNYPNTVEGRLDANEKIREARQAGIQGVWSSTTLGSIGKDFYTRRELPFDVVRHQEIKLTKDVDGDPYVFVKDYEAKNGILIKEHRYTGRSFKSKAKAERFVKETMKDMEGR